MSLASGFAGRIVERTNSAQGLVVHVDAEARWPNFSEEAAAAAGLQVDVVTCTSLEGKEIETDKRVIKEKVVLLKEKLKTIDKQNENRRKSRTNVARVALVGYTNVGKSTLMNQLSKSEVSSRK